MLSINVKVTDQATPALAMIGDSLKDRRGLHKSMAGTIEDLTRAHIRIAAQTRHKTAGRLGAAPTNYLTKKSETIESHADGVGVVLSVYGAIFARVTRYVVVTPVNRKWLTIPANAAAYGRRAGEFANLKFVKLDENLAMLIESKGAGKAHKSKVTPQRKRDRTPHQSKPTPKGTKNVFFWLVKKTTVPQDRGLLPSDEQFNQAAELGARNFLEQQIAASKAGGFTPPGGYSRA